MWQVKTSELRHFFFFTFCRNIGENIELKSVTPQATHWNIEISNIIIGKSTNIREKLNAMKKVLSIVAVLCTIAYVSALENGLALTPPMGWMSWQRFRCIIDCDERPDECIRQVVFKHASFYLISPLGDGLFTCYIMNKCVAMRMVRNKFHLFHQSCLIALFFFISLSHSRSETEN